MRPSTLKTVLAHPGIDELLTMHQADALASGRSTEHVEYCKGLLEKWTEEDLNPRPLVSGEDLKQLGLTPGPQYKRLLDAVREAQLDGTISTKEQALELIRRLLEEENKDKH
jgi:poly(A) polymerase